MKRTFQTFLALAVLLVGATLARAQAAKPVMVLTIPGYQDLLADADFLGGLAGKPGSSQMAEGMLKMMTQGKGLNGLDKTKPLAVVLNLGGDGQFSPVVCVPVTNAKDLTDTLAMLNVTGPAQDDGGVMKLTAMPPVNAVYVHEQSGWAYVTQTKDAPLPDDPMKALAGLVPDYDVAVRVYLQNVPAEMKKSWIDKFHSFMEFAAAAQQQRGDNPLSELSQKNMESQVAAIEQLLNQADQITLGWKLNRDAKNTHLDVTFTAVPGSQLDQSMQQMAQAKTNFAGFVVPTAAATLNFCGVSTPENIEQSVNTLNQLKAKMEEAVGKDQNLPDDNARNQVKTALDKLFDVAEKTVKSGKMDGGAVLQLGPDQLQLAAGGFVADGPGFEAAIKNLVELAKGEPEFSNIATVKFDLETYKEVRFHQITAKLPPDADEAAKKIFGDSVELYIGVGPDSAYVAFGKNSLALAKSVIDHSAADPNKPAPPFRLSIALAPIFDFAAWVNPGDPKSALMAQAFDKVKGKDHVLIDAKMIPNGLTYRFDVEDGVLAAAGDIGKMSMPGPRGPARPMGGPGGPPPGAMPPGGPNN